MVLEQLVGHLEKYYVVALHHYAKVNVFKMIFRCARYLTSLTLKNKAIQTLRESMEEICLNLDVKNDILSKNQ